MKIFSAKYEESYKCSCCRTDEEYMTIVANSKSEALGLAMEFIDTSKVNEWTIEEVDCSRLNVHRVY
jgi:hypothetical protein